MIVEFSKRATADLQKIAVDSHSFGERVAKAVEARIREIITHIAEYPEAGIRIAERPSMRMIPLGRFPYEILYRVSEDRIRILPIRHRSRRSWTKER